MGKSYNNPNVNPNVIGTGEVVDNSLTAADIAANAITSSELADNAVDTAALQDASVTAAKLAGNAVAGSNLTDESVLAADIGPNAVGQSELADGAVDTAAIIDGQVTGAKIATDTITTNNIAAGGVASSEIADNTVSSTDIADGTIQAVDFAPGAVGTASVTDGSITVAKMADVQAFTASGTIVVSDGNLVTFSGPASQTLTLPTSPTIGTELEVWNIDSADAVSLARGGTDTINGGTSAVSIPYGWHAIARFVATGTWLVQLVAPVDHLVGKVLAQGKGTFGGGVIGTATPSVFQTLTNVPVKANRTYVVSGHIVLGNGASGAERTATVEVRHNDIAITTGLVVSLPLSSPHLATPFAWAWTPSADLTADLTLKASASAASSVQGYENSLIIQPA